MGARSTVYYSNCAGCPALSQPQSLDENFFFNDDRIGLGEGKWFEKALRKEPFPAIWVRVRLKKNS